MKVAPRSGIRHVVVLAAFLGLVCVAIMVWPNEKAAATDVRFTPSQQARFLAEMRENLNGHPNNPRFGLVSVKILVREGVTACKWLATEPALDQARREEDVRSRYFAAHPRVAGAWPFRQGETGLREEILTNSWGWLCANIWRDHIDSSPLSEEGD